MSDFITEYLTTYFDEITPFDFYRSIFPEGELEEQGIQQEGKYNAIAVEVLPEAQDGKANIRRRFIHNGLESLPELLESENFIIVSPISYAGKSRKSENARYIYALAFDIDGITEKHYLTDLFHQINKVEHLPRPTYTVASGTGLHLYYQLEKPIPCYPNINKQLARFKKSLTRRLWNLYTTSLAEKVQYESVFQGFRLVGGITKNGGRTRAFITGEKVSIEYLNGFIYEEKDKVIDYTYKSELSLAEAKIKYPEWYERRIVQKQPKGGWTCHKGLYEWWLKQIDGGATVGHRYYCVMCLAIYAKKCNIPREELEEMAFGLVDFMESLTDDDNNHFTRADVLSALEMYNDSYLTFPIDTIINLTNIHIQKNKRNGRKQAEHIKIMNFIRDEINGNKDWRKSGGRKPKEAIVKEWLAAHPDGTKAECCRSTGLTKPTVYKYWPK